MSNFDSLTLAFEDWFDTPLCDLPETLRRRVEQEFADMPWDRLSADQRRSVALQLDYQHDPATEQDQQFWWDFFQHINAIKENIAEWEAVAAPTAADLALRETRLAELRQELARMEIQKRQARGDYYPARKRLLVEDEVSSPSPGLHVQYVAYPKAMYQLAERLDATPEEMAAWVWMGPEDGGIAAYLNANELDPPPRFHYSIGSGNGDDFDYLSPLMACWFKEHDLAQFGPTEHYITGAALIERWSRKPGIQPVAFIQAKIVESRLLDIHPIYGGTQGGSPDDLYCPPLASGLFALSEIKKIEVEDFAAAVGTSGDPPSEIVSPVNRPENPDVGSSEWRTQNARAAANALHDRPGGNRDKQRKIRKLWASGKYSSRDLCAEQECAGLEMSFAAARKALVNTPEPSRC